MVTYHHLAPQLIEGTMKQCVLTNVYSLGKLLGRITSSAHLVGLEDDSLGRVQQLIQQKKAVSTAANGQVLVSESKGANDFRDYEVAKSILDMATVWLSYWQTMNH